VGLGPISEAAATVIEIISDEDDALESPVEALPPGRRPAVRGGTSLGRRTTEKAATSVAPLAATEGRRVTKSATVSKTPASAAVQRPVKRRAASLQVGGRGIKKVTRCAESDDGSNDGSSSCSDSDLDSDAGSDPESDSDEDGDTDEDGDSEASDTGSDNGDEEEDESEEDPLPRAGRSGRNRGPAAGGSASLAPRLRPGSKAPSRPGPASADGDSSSDDDDDDSECSDRRRCLLLQSSLLTKVASWPKLSPISLPNVWIVRILSSQHMYDTHISIMTQGRDRHCCASFAQRRRSPRLARSWSGPGRPFRLSWALRHRLSRIRRRSEVAFEEAPWAERLIAAPQDHSSPVEAERYAGWAERPIAGQRLIFRQTLSCTEKTIVYSGSLQGVAPAPPVGRVTRGSMSQYKHAVK